MRYLEFKKRCAIKVQAYVRGYFARKLVRALREEMEKRELERKRNVAAVRLQVSLVIYSFLKVG